ncbi:MAG: T9SS type A sorting domain-containing protein, partial [Cyclobacteriaceae bacterium]
LFCGGDGGSGHMWSALSHMYCGLLDHGFPAENIFVLSYDGTASPETNQSLNLDNDPDEIPDILPVPCDTEQLGIVFQQLENDLDEGDILYVFATTHGVQDEPYPTPTESNFVLWEDELLDDDVFASMLEGINCSQMIFNIFACFAGGFTDELVNLNNSARKTILTCTAWEHPYVRSANFNNQALMDPYNYLICSALRGGHPDIENHAPWNSPYIIGESPFFTTLFPNSGGEINFDFLVNGGNNNGIQEINETILYGEENDFQFFAHGDKINDCGFIEDLLSLKGITGKVENTQTVDGSFYIGGNLSVESNVNLTLNDNTKFFLHNSEITVTTSANLILGNNIIFIAKEGDCKIIIDGNISVGSNVSFIAEDGAELEIVLNNNALQATFENAVFENCKIDSDASKLTITSSLFNDFYRLLSHRGTIHISNTDFISNSTQSWLYLENTEDNNNPVSITDCNFSTTVTTMVAIDIWNYNNFNISNNTIDGFYNGIQIIHSGYGKPKNQMIKDNNIINCDQRGILTFATKGEVFRNHITNNGYGVWFCDHSSIRLYGYSGAVSYSQTQEIKDNSSYEVYASEYSFPIYFRYNVIIDEDNLGVPSDPLVYHSGSPTALKDVRYNCWGVNFDPEEDFYPSGYIWEPTWCPEIGGGMETSPDEDMFEVANNLFEAEDHSSAKSMYEMLIDQYPESKFALAAMQELFALERFVSDDYSSLKQYYTTNSTIQSDADLAETGDYMASKCDVKLENWPGAIDYYENIILDPETMEDSIFAIIDLGYVYFVMENSGYKSAYTGNLVQYKPESKEQFFDYRNYLLSLIPGDQLSETMKENIASLNEGELLQNVPNPFKGSTQIWYKLNTESNVKLNVYNYTGQLISSIDEGTKTKGNHSIDYDATGLKNGIYFYSISINGQTTDSKKMTIMK